MVERGRGHCSWQSEQDIWRPKSKKIRAQLVVKVWLWLQYRVQKKTEFGIRVSKMLNCWILGRDQKKVFVAVKVLLFLSLFILLAWLPSWWGEHVVGGIECDLEKRWGFYLSGWGVVFWIRVKQVRVTKMKLMYSSQYKGLIKIVYLQKKKLLFLFIKI